MGLARGACFRLLADACNETFDRDRALIPVTVLTEPDLASFLLAVANAEGTYYRYMKAWLARRRRE